MSGLPHTPEEVETTRRFQWLRMLIDHPQRRHQLLFVFGMMSLAIVSLIAFFVATLRILPFDLAMTRELQEISDLTFLQAMVFVSSFGYLPWSVISVAGSLLIVGVLLGWKPAAYLLLLTCTQAIANNVIKIVIGRPRPLSTLVNVVVPVAGNSFPSGHVMFYTVFFGFMLFLVWTQLPASLWRLIVVAFLASLIMLIGPSRMYLGAHWLSDVIAAHLLGLIMLTFGIEFYLHYVAPRQPLQQQGLIGAYHRAGDE